MPMGESGLVSLLCGPSDSKNTDVKGARTRLSLSRRSFSACLRSFFVHRRQRRTRRMASVMPPTAPPAIGCIRMMGSRSERGWIRKEMS